MSISSRRVDENRKQGADGRRRKRGRGNGAIGGRRRSATALEKRSTESEREPVASSRSQQAFVLSKIHSQLR